MERRISDLNILESFALDFCSVAERHVKYIVVSGFVAIASGRSRATEDIDMIIEKIPKEKFILFNKELEEKDFECMQSSLAEEVYDYLQRGDSIRYTRKGNNFFPPEMEVKFPKDELDEWQLRERQKIRFIGLDIWFSSVNFNIAFKEELLKTIKDMEDAKHLRDIYKNEISDVEINKIKEMIIKLRLKDER